jgi:fimbrial chaperone protein
MRRFSMMLAGFGLALCRADLVSASVFRVTPVQVALSRGTTSTLVTLGNDGDRELRLQVSAFAWEQAPDGTMKLSPTRDVVFFPMMLKLAPGEERKVRVGTTLQGDATEKSYRIFVEELPPAPELERTAGFQVRVLTKIGIPVFVEPTNPKPAAAVEVVEVAADHVRYKVRNVGNAHFTLQSVRLQGLDASGQSVLDRQADGWYVLAGGEREFEQPLSPELCGLLKSVAIEAKTEAGNAAARQDVPVLACMPGRSVEVASSQQP